MNLPSLNIKKNNRFGNHTFLLSFKWIDYQPPCSLIKKAFTCHMKKRTWRKEREVAIITSKLKGDNEGAINSNDSKTSLSLFLFYDPTRVSKVPSRSYDTDSINRLYRPIQSFAFKFHLLHCVVRLYRSVVKVPFGQNKAALGLHPWIGLGKE
jgi:hypothetical protein